MRKISEIKGIGQVMAIACVEKGYQSVEDIAEATVAGLSNVPGIGRIRAKEFIGSAQMMLNNAPQSLSNTLSNGADREEKPAEFGTLEHATNDIVKRGKQVKKKKPKNKKDKKKKKEKAKDNKKKQKQKKKKKSQNKKSERKKDKKKQGSKKKDKKSKKSKKNKKSKKKK